MSNGSFDYIVVGAGPAGCVLANRLTTAPGTTVALVEAGGPDTAREIRIPAAFSKLFTTPYDWNYRTSKQTRLADRELYWPRGKTLGGSTSINAQMWVRGHRADYDGWGVEGWSYDDVLPYFQRAERRVGVAAGGSYGTKGPVWISDLRTQNPATAAFLAACVEAGIPAQPDLNGPDNSGCSPTPVTQRRGRRWSAVDAYLRPARRRPNLRIVTGAHVERVELEEGRAVGVTYRGTDGSAVRLTAKREVILCAGAVNTPQLLMLSGIGEPEQLRSVGIEPRHELPGVGANLQDHLAAGATVRCPLPITMTGAETLGSLVRYLTLRRGLLSSNVAEAVAFIRSAPDLPAPDLELVFGPVVFVEHGFVPPVEHGLTVGVVLLQPDSRGRIGLTSSNPADPPLIDANYLDADADLARLLAGVRVAESLLRTEALRPYVGPPLDPYPGEVDDEALADNVRQHAETLYHPVGTCRMGDDPDSVVDGELRVRGVRALRVVDASVMPRVNRGHTMAPVYMIAERAAALLEGEAFPRS